MAVFTLEDEQIVWTVKSSQMDKSSDFLENWTNKFSEDLIRLNLSVCLSVCEVEFLKTICSSRRTSRPKSDLTSHSDGLRRTNCRFARHGGMEVGKRAMVFEKFCLELRDQTVRRFVRPDDLFVF